MQSNCSNETKEESIQSGQTKIELTPDKANSFQSNSTDSVKAQSHSTCSIFGQTWMTENLNVDRFKNGDLIPQAQSEEEWANASNKKQPAWCYPEQGTGFGKLYNWYAISDKRGLAPKGWHIPTEKEFSNLRNRVLEDRLYRDEGEGYRLKSNYGWMPSDRSYVCNGNGNGNDRYGFKAVPAGNRIKREAGDYIFYGYGTIAEFWTSEQYVWYPDGYWEDSTVRSNDDEEEITVYRVRKSGPPDNSQAYYYSLNNMNCLKSSFDYGQYKKFIGLSVRCIKDKN